MANEDSRALLTLYAIPYWATQILTWLVLPLHQLYADAGDFTVRARLRTSVRENGLFYAVLGILGLIVMIVLVVTRGISVAGIMSGAVAISLSFSIASGVFLMGYGFSEIPRVCWLRSSLSARKRWCARSRTYRAPPRLHACGAELAFAGASTASASSVTSLRLLTRSCPSLSGPRSRCQTPCRGGIICAGRWT